MTVLPVQVTSAASKGVCGSVTSDAQGRIVTVCVGLGAITPRLQDPGSLRTLPSYDLPPWPAGYRAQVCAGTKVSAMATRHAVTRRKLLAAQHALCVRHE